MLKTLTRSSVVLAFTAASLAVASVAAAVLPGTASDTAREHTAEISIPGPNAAATGDHATGSSAEAKTTETVGEVAGDNHGATVSELATTTELTGAEKGAAIAAVASDGRSEARGESAKGREKSAGRRP